MKFNIAYPVTGCQLALDIDDERKLRPFFDKRISEEVDGEVLGEQFRGYIFRISGGNDMQGFAMQQGVLTSTRVRLMLADGMKSFRPRREGQRKRKSVRGCIVGSDLSVLNLVVVKKGKGEVAGLTDVTIPRRLGPKRASKIKKLFNLTDADDVRKHVIPRSFETKKGKKVTKRPKIQRLVTPIRLERKRQMTAEANKRRQASRDKAKAYKTLILKRANLLQEERKKKIAATRAAKLAKKVVKTTTTDKPKATATAKTVKKVTGK